MNISLEHGIGWIPVCIVIAAALSYFFTFKEKNINPSSLRYILSLLRFLGIFGILLLLLNPLLQLTKQNQDDPVILFLQDNTKSLELAIPKPLLSDYLNNRQKLLDKLSQKFKVRSYTFDKKLNTDKINFKGEITDINNALQEALERNSGDNISAIVLSSDGIYNSGINPIYNAALQKTPCYTVTLGDTTVKKDLILRSVRHNDLVYLHDKFSIIVDVSAYKLRGANTALQVYDGTGKNIYSNTLMITDDDYSSSIEIAATAERVGMQQYKVVLTPVAGEMTNANNTEYVFVEVIDGRQKVLAIYDAPHPDVKALKNVVEKNKNYSFEAVSMKDYKGNFNDYNYIILHGLPSSRNREKSELIASIFRSPISMMIIHNTFTDWNLLSSWQEVLKIGVGNANGNEVYPSLNTEYNKFTIPNEWDNALNKYPPVIAPYGKYILGKNAEVLAYQRIGSVNTTFPLIVTGATLGKKIAVVASEGIWRWRMTEKEESGHFDEVFEKILQYTSVKNDKRKFRLSIHKPLFSEQESILMDAELYNESMELVNEPDVNVSIRSDKGKMYKYIFDKTVNSYTLNAGNFVQGNYKVVATVNFQGKAYTASGDFIVRPTVLEATQLRADYGLLRSMSNQSGARSVPMNEIGTLYDILSKDERVRPRLYDSTETKSFIDRKILFVIILLLFALEWLLRKLFLG